MDEDGARVMILPGAEEIREGRVDSSSIEGGRMCCADHGTLTSRAAGAPSAPSQRKPKDHPCGPNPSRRSR